MAAPDRARLLHRAAACVDPNPWDSRIRCELPAGHYGLHASGTAFDRQRWSDGCHWPGDDCRPCTNPNRST